MKWMVGCTIYVTHEVEADNELDAEELVRELDPELLLVDCHMDINYVDEIEKG
jgi:hypothetical protein